MKHQIIPYTVHTYHEASNYAKKNADKHMKNLRMQKTNSKRHLYGIKMGRLVCLCVSDLLFINDIEHILTEDAKGYCIILSNKLTIQVRFHTNQSNYRNLLELENRVKNTPHDFYVAATAIESRSEVKVCGYATLEEIKHAPIKDFGQGKMNHYLPLVDLMNFENLLVKLSGKSFHDLNIIRRKPPKQSSIRAII